MDTEEFEYRHSLYIASLIHKELEKELLTEKEREDLNAWIHENDHQASMYSALQDRNMLAAEMMGLTKYDTQTATREVLDELGIRSARTRRLRRTRSWTAAAAILILLLGGAALFTIKERRPVPAHQMDISAGGNKAILTLGDGSRIILDSVHNGQVARQQTTIISRQNGQLIYNATSGSKAINTEFNTVTTPRGGQFTVVLPDGSKVMLNAASSLRYPTAFTGKDRTVELAGEAYFEVARKLSQPFIVKTPHQDIMVLGTVFDMMTYNDEPAERTTLVNGCVVVIKGVQMRILKPGQQAMVGNGAKDLAVADADVDKETAWTTGFFKFDHTDIRTIMRQICRWYDIEVFYEAKMNDSDTYSGRISRNLPLSDLITFLESNGIHHFRLEGKKLTLLP